MALMLGFSLISDAQISGAAPDEVLARYPEGFTKLLVANLAKLDSVPFLASSILEPLQAARHPLNGVRQIVTDTLQLPTQLTSFVAHGTGPGFTGTSLIQGLPQEAAFGALFGLQFAVGAPMSPFTNWELSQSNGLPVIRTGGMFGPVQIQWAYTFAGNALWVSTETSFGPPPNVEQLAATVNAVTNRAQGRGAYFDELLIGVNVRGGDISFVRETDISTDRPAAPGDQAAGFSIVFTNSGAIVNFNVRFDTSADAANALADLNAGTSPYLAQDLYNGTLVSARQFGMELVFTVVTDFTGAVGLLLVAMPN
jgi:hypothetical protein